VGITDEDDLLSVQRLLCGADGSGFGGGFRRGGSFAAAKEPRGQQNSQSKGDDLLHRVTSFLRKIERFGNILQRYFIIPADRLQYRRRRKKILPEIRKEDLQAEKILV